MRRALYGRVRASRPKNVAAVRRRATATSNVLPGTGGAATTDAPRCSTRSSSPPSGARRSPG